MNELVHYVNQLAGGNQFLSGFIGAWVLSVGTWLLRNVPLRIVTRIKMAVVATLQINSIEGENTTRGDEQLGTVTRWLLEHGWSPTLRNFRRSINGENVLSAGTTVWFLWRRRLMWVTVDELSINSGTKYRVVVSAFCLGNANALLKAWYTEVRRTDPAPEGYVTTDLVSPSRWGAPTANPVVTPIRRLETLPVDLSVKTKLVTAVKGLLDNRQWYIDNVVPRKLVILATGVPGCGKTSLGMALANHFNLPMSLVTNGAFTPVILRELICGAGGKELPRFILVDDIDCREEILARTAKEPIQGNTTISSGENVYGLADYLAVFGGGEPMDNVIIFMTTNHPEKIDPAFRRSGRIDITLDLGGTTPAQQREFALKHWPDLKDRIGEDFFQSGCVAADLFNILALARWETDVAYRLLVELARKESPLKEVVNGD